MALIKNTTFSKSVYYLVIIRWQESYQRTAEKPVSYFILNRGLCFLYFVSNSYIRCTMCIVCFNVQLSDDDDYEMK